MVLHEKQKAKKDLYMSHNYCNWAHSHWCVLCITPILAVPYRFIDRSCLAHHAPCFITTTLQYANVSTPNSLGTKLNITYTLISPLSMKQMRKCICGIPRWEMSEETLKNQIRWKQQNGPEEQRHWLHFVSHLSTTTINIYITQRCC